MRAAILVCLVVGACSGDSGAGDFRWPDGGPVGGPVGGGGGGGGGDLAAAGRDLGGGADLGASPIAACLHACNNVTDCASPQNVLLSVDNYRCVAGACQYLGCANDLQCQTAQGSAGWSCRSNAGALPACAMNCNAAADCAGTTPTTSASHYACDHGSCVWLGCATDAECVTELGAGSLCRPSVGSAVKTCQHGCAVPADCASGGPLLDAAHYRCTAGLCAWQGCASTPECLASYGNGYLCR